MCAVALTALIGAMIFAIGCGCLVHSDQPYGPRVTGDGVGGAIAVYEDIKGGNQHDFYVQRISPEGDILWGDEGVLIGGGYKYWDSFHDLHLVSDGSGGALVSWLASASSEQREYISHVTSVDSEGNVRWQREVRAVDHMISDGAGGAIIATDYSRDERTLFVIKIDPEGNFPWGEDGVSFYVDGYQANSLQLVSDSDGGAIIAWQERTGEPGERVTCVYTQKVNTEGSQSWGQDGVLLYTSSEEAGAEELRLTGDGSGGAIAIWMQVPRGKVEDDSPKALLWDICAQRLDAQGNTLWTENGIRLGITEGGGQCPTNRVVASDGAGGAIAIWEDLRKGLTSVYAQKIDTDGNIKWQPGGEEVCYIETNSSFWPYTAVSDGSGGAIITFGVRAQRIDVAGRIVWPDGGIRFTAAGTHATDYDGHGGAVIAWGESRRSYVQRIDAEGNLLWGTKGIRLNP
ncbi:hypothetical protein ES703_92895 [subsurface metagenome]